MELQLGSAGSEFHESGSAQVHASSLLHSPRPLYLQRRDEPTFPQFPRQDATRAHRQEARHAGFAVFEVRGSKSY